MGMTLATEMKALAAQKPSIREAKEDEAVKDYWEMSLKEQIRKIASEGYMSLDINVPKGMNTMKLRVLLELHGFDISYHLGKMSIDWEHV